jgi:hypothetical protein
MMGKKSTRWYSNFSNTFALKPLKTFKRFARVSKIKEESK